MSDKPGSPDPNRNPSPSDPGPDGPSPSGSRDPILDWVGAQSDPYQKAKDGERVTGDAEPAQAPKPPEPAAAVPPDASTVADAPPGAAPGAVSPDQPIDFEGFVQRGAIADEERFRDLDGEIAMREMRRRAREAEKPVEPPSDTGRRRLILSILIPILIVLIALGLGLGLSDLQCGDDDGMLSAVESPTASQTSVSAGGPTGSSLGASAGPSAGSSVEPPDSLFEHPDYLASRQALGLDLTTVDSEVQYNDIDVTFIYQLEWTDASGGSAGSIGDVTLTEDPHREGGPVTIAGSDAVGAHIVGVAKGAITLDLAIKIPGPDGGEAGMTVLHLNPDGLTTNVKGSAERVEGDTRTALEAGVYGTDIR